jgi:hypothetical protein
MAGLHAILNDDRLLLGVIFNKHVHTQIVIVRELCQVALVLDGRLLMCRWLSGLGLVVKKTRLVLIVD